MLLVCLLIVSSDVPRGARCQTSYFDDYPAWSSGLVSETYAVALGDVDGDGDLDLVCGNFVQSTTLYLNTAGVLETMPAWSSGPDDYTYSVAMGDIDRDGDLDLVCGNLGTTTLYLNVGGTFEAEPSWSSGQVNSTASVALGDIDDDGDLDLVCGNDGSLDVLDPEAEPTTLYLNEGGTFETMPAWSSGLASFTKSVALGDIDRDGDLDLVCGNNGESATVYVNQAGVLDTMPSWSSGVMGATHGVTLGDVDADGDLDLVCGNLGASSTLYLNQSGVLEVLPSWISDAGGTTRGVTFGDVDGDGDLDLVCGNNGATTLYLNQAGVLDTTASWSSGLSMTTSVALGDIDGDGDLDLVRGNRSSNTTLSLNRAGFFETTPSWSSPRADTTMGVALGDVNGDGDLDLVCGNIGRPTTLYLNQSGTFETLPSWSSGRSDSTYGVALSDVDDDGDLDLTCGNHGESSTLYLNQGGMLETLPSWSAGQVNSTYGVALGDIDGDGDPDLACGNNNESTTLYLNRGGTFETLPSWSAGRPNATIDVALGDIDGDGYSDLICGNAREATNLYMSQGSLPESLPSWSSGLASRTTDVTLGDVNGDGDPDLICGNYSEPTTMYARQGDKFETLPSWSSGPAGYTYGVALGDVDADGDLDLICGNYRRSVTLYLNQKGMFDTTPSWSSGAAGNTSRVALGDVDGDGDLDLVCGDLGHSSSFYRGLRTPAYRGDPTNPTRQLPNNAGHLRWVDAHRSEPNARVVHFTALDIESDPIWLVLEYQHEGAPQWYPADIVGHSGKAGPFGTSPAGVTDSLEWDTHLLPFDKREVILRLRTIEIPRRVSVIQHAASYLLDVGTVEPHRPEISASADAVTFATVTVGDTASVDVVIRNTGNLPLIVDDIELPSTEMSHGLPTPFGLSPGETDTLRIFLEPRIQYGVSGDVRITSNDPLTPILPIAVTTDIRALHFRTRLLNPSQEVPLGEALGLNIIPDSDVVIEKGYVHYRPAGSTGAWTDSVGIARLAEGDFVATIPGEGVTEAGLEYYIRVENSGVYATDPPGAPVDSVFHQAVASPSAMATTAIPSRGAEFLQGQDIRVQVSLPLGASFEEGTIHFRRGGATEFEDVTVAPGDPLPYAVIPGQAADPRGIEYWVEIQTLTQRLTDPPGDPARVPRVLRVTTTDLTEPASHPGERYRLLSIPLELNTPLVGVVTDDIGGPDNTRWRIFAYDAVGASYTELPSTDISSFVLGKGYWLITKESHQLDTAPAEGLSTSTGDPFSIPLTPGWNLVGNPFAFPVAWDSMTVDGIPMNEAEGALVERARAWVTSNNSYNDPVTDPVGTFISFDGYWIKNLTDSAVTLQIPPREAVTVAQSGPQRGVARMDRGVEVWLLGITATCGALSDRGDYIGVRPIASDEFDKSDRSEVPMPPGEDMSLYFPHWSWGRHSGTYSVDIRPVSTADRGNESGEYVEVDSPGHTWLFDISKNFSQETAGDEVVLEFSGLEAIPEDVEVVLLDRTLEQRVDLRKETRYAFFQGKREFITRDEDARFTLLVGSEEFVAEHQYELPSLPTRTLLHQNRPNPFNPSTIIQYELAQPGRVTVKIYDISGALVRTLEDRDRQPGRYEIGWNAVDDRGSRVSSGVYFYRMGTHEFTQTRKMVILK